MGFNKAFEDKKFMIFYVRKLSYINYLFQIVKIMKLVDYKVSIVIKKLISLYQSSIRK